MMKKKEKNTHGPEIYPGTYEGLRSFLTTSSTAEIIKLIRHGLPSSILESLRTHFSIAPNALSKLLNISPTTIRRATQKKRTLPMALTEKIVRISMIEIDALKIFNQEFAIQWLKQPSISLNGEAPIDWMDTEIGAREVTKLLFSMPCGGCI